MISEKLYKFLKEWYSWATAAKVEDTFQFKKDTGLCSSLVAYSCHSVEMQLELISELENDFKGNYQFPFDKNFANYWQVKKSSSHYKNPKRVAWVKSKIEDYEKGIV